MMQRICNHAAILIVGIVLGGGLVLWTQNVDVAPKAYASATHGADNFAIATGQVENGIEALYFLDFLTGDLRATVISRRNGAFTGIFAHNVLADFEGVLEDPKFLLVTGLATLPRGRGTSQLADSLIYVAEATSGQVVAYALPFNSTLHAAGKPQAGQFLKVAGGSFRDAFVRD
ncbi:MAG: hypothetical protein KDA61_21965 [Planctomycetales bacterium]|nr:hypothetical protein [Planctomycetales bacterium]